MPRLFFALLPDEDTKEVLQQLSTTLLLSTRQRTRAENWHVTLVFIGNVNAAMVPKIIHAAMPIKTQAFTLVFDQLEFWRKKGIVCLTCSEPEAIVNNLVAQLSTPLADLDLKLDARPYYPHLTLARRVQEKPTAVLEPIVWNAQQFALVESLNSDSGVIYRPLRVWGCQ